MGTTINTENYNKIKSVITNEEIEYIDNNIYNKIQKSQKAVAYKTLSMKLNYITIGNDTFLLNQKIIPSTEVNSVKLNSTIVDDIHTTEYKQIHLWVFLNNDGSHSFVLQNSWKKIPSAKSFDVIALRWEGSVVESRNTTYGEQEYKDFTSQVNPPTITYPHTNGNYKYADNGVGLSQNLVNGSYYYVNQLEISATCSGKIKVFGTYQHAKDDITLANSKSYSFYSSGLGGVLDYSNSTIRNTYDNMQGLDVTFNA